MLAQGTAQLLKATQPQQNQVLLLMEYDWQQEPMNKVMLLAPSATCQLFHSLFSGSE